MATILPGRVFPQAAGNAAIVPDMTAGKYPSWERRPTPAGGQTQTVSMAHCLLLVAVRRLEGEPPLPDDLEEWLRPLREKYPEPTPLDEE